VPSSSDSMKLIPSTGMSMSSILDLMRPMYNASSHSTWAGLLCDSLVKVAQYLKCDGKGVSSHAIIVTNSLNLLNRSTGEEILNSALLKFCRSAEKLCPMYKMSFRIICVKIGYVDPLCLRDIRLLLRCVGDYIQLEMIENSALHLEFEVKYFIRRTQPSVRATIELPSLDDSRASLAVRLEGCSISACEELYACGSPLFLHMLCTLPRGGLDPCCIAGNPCVVRPWLDLDFPDRYSAPLFGTPYVCVHQMYRQLHHVQGPQ
jgi:hypothetical protein